MKWSGSVSSDTEMSGVCCSAGVLRIHPGEEFVDGLRDIAIEALRPLERVEVVQNLLPPGRREALPRLLRRRVGGERLCQRPWNRRSPGLEVVLQCHRNPIPHVDGGLLPHLAVDKESMPPFAKRHEARPEGMAVDRSL